MRTGFQDEGYGFDTFGLSPPWLDTAGRLARPFYDHYFRVDSVGTDGIPEQGPAILVANHGGVLPLDAAILALDVARRTSRIVRPVTDHFVPQLPLASTVLSRLGVVSGTRANVKRLLTRGELIAIWPEGVSGPAKHFRDRYRIQQWSVGFAELAIRFRAPVIPVAIVGAEESWPMLAKLGLRIFGSPYLPLPMSPVPLPAKFYLRYGEPVDLCSGCGGDASDPTVISRAAASIRSLVEDLLLYTLATRAGVFR